MNLKLKNNKKESRNSTAGITLVALVVTIVVLLILAGVSLNLVLGENGIISKAKESAEGTAEADAKAQLEMLLLEYQMNNSLEDDQVFEEFLLSKGAESVIDNGDTYIVEYKGYEFEIDKDTLTINSTSKIKGVKPEFTVEQTLNVKCKVEITVTVINEVGSVDEIIITNLNNGTTQTATITGKTGTVEVELNGDYRVTVKATTDGVQKSASEKITVNQIPVEFSTAYGRIEVVWIDQNNNIIEEPLSPILNGMTAVKWNGVTETETTDTDQDWYKYQAISGTGDNTTSRWANAKNGDKGYFVWIPRYAYRITYYASQDSDIITGYCDGDGIREVNGNIKYALDAGIRTIESTDGTKYIVHPAFVNEYTNDGDDTNDYLNGGWNSELAGIWVAKYEMSREGASPTSSGSGTTFYSLPNVQSARSITIGDMYTYSQNYDSSKVSHLMKNSEWGAVAYLTHSQYGRNGNEIRINNNSNCITGSAAKTVDANSSTDTYTYNQVDTDGTYLGGLASSTGNITGIYDLSGGAWEYIAAFNDTDSNNYESSYGSSFAATTNNSTRFATKYSNSTETNSGTKIYEVGKIGDAIKEVYNVSYDCKWFSDNSRFVYASSPFFRRGGYGYYTSGAGVFYSYDGGGAVNNGGSFRVCLAF